MRLISGNELASVAGGDFDWGLYGECVGGVIRRYVDGAQELAEEVVEAFQSEFVPGHMPGNGG